MTARKREAVAPAEIVEALLREASPKLVLVGGQALAFWMDRYRVEMPRGVPYVSRDIDFLTDSRADVAEVRRLARVLGGSAIIPHARSLTALVGQAVRDVSDEEFINVDVIHRVIGADAAVVRSRAVRARRGDVELRVMHPLDVLKSRVDNLHRLAEKQNDVGCAQLEAAISVARRFVESCAKTANVREMLRYVGFIERLARSDAGRKVARRFGLHVADAIEPNAVASRPFRERELPKILTLMSAARRRAIGEG